MLKIKDVKWVKKDENLYKYTSSSFLSLSLFKLGRYSGRDKWVVEYDIVNDYFYMKYKDCDEAKANAIPDLLRELLGDLVKVVEDE